jgi:hypothetical protein
MIQVIGLADLQRELRKLGPALPKALREANLEASREVAVPAVRKGAPVRSGALKASVRPLASQRRAQVAIGYARVPYVFPINFGWPARNIRAQEFVYSGIAKVPDKLVDVYADKIDKLTARAFPIPG